MGSVMTAIELQDNFTNILNQVINSVNLGISAMEDLHQAMNSSVDTASIDGARAAIEQAALAARELEDAMQGTVPPGLDPPPVNWQSPTMEVFTENGMERFQQEVQSTNNMLQQLGATQDDIARRAYNTDIFSQEAFNDLNRMAVRIDSVRDRIQQIENNPLNMGTDVANAELELLRGQLDQAVQIQQNLNRAVDNMDVQAANEAYLRLEQTIGGTERHIRDNFDEQGRFNREIEEGTQQASELTDTIKNAVLAYVSVQSIGNALNISDELMMIISRLNMMNDGVQSTQELVNMVYAAAQDARGSFAEMADVVARFGNNAKDAFSSSEEVVAFADLVQKQMTIAGASTQEASNAMLQLSQALGSGMLRGDELNSIFEQAPNLIQSIADYLDVPIGQIREMASEGELSADVVKAAIFASADEINTKFEQMPMTWGQIWQSMQNTALIAFQPVLQRLNDIANSQDFQTFVNGVIEAMATLANILLNIFDLAATVGGFITDNWSIISPIVYGVVGALAVYAAYLGIVKAIEIASAAASMIHALAMSAKIGITATLTGSTMAATAAQMGYNGALYACPIVWIIILIIGLIALFYAAVAAVNKFAGTSVSATGIICGVFMIAAAFIGNLFVTLINFVIDIFVVLWNFIAVFANFFGNVFDDPVGAIARLFFDLVDSILGLLESLASAIDTIFGSNLAGAVSGWRDSLGSWVDETFGQGEEIMAKMDASSMHLDRFEYGAAWDAGYSFGEGIDESIANFDPSSLFGTTDIPSADDYAGALADGAIGGGIDDIAGNTGAMADAMDITGEELKYLRDIAEQEAINRYTTAEITIEQTNHNTIKNGMDLDGIMSGMTDMVNEAIDISTEGVHV